MNISKFLSMAFIIAGIGMAVGMQKVLVKSVEASVSSYTVSTFAQYCANNSTICNKVDFQNVFTGSVSCPAENQQISNIYVHAGDGQTVYELPDSGFQSVYSNNNNTVQVTANPHPHALSWLGVVCSNSATPTPTPPTNPNGGTIEVNPGLCGETTFSAKKKGTHGVTNMYLVVDSQGIAQSQNVPSNGDEVAITVGPFTSNQTLKYRLFGGGERDYDLPLWNGHGTPTFSADVNAFGQINGWAWVTNNTTNPFTNWYEINVEGCRVEQPTPNPEKNSKVYFSTTAPTCDSNQVVAQAHIQTDGVDQSGVRVVFKYNDIEKVVYTGNNGKTSTSFSYGKDGYVEVQPEGFASDFHYITKETECSNSGQVLGASTQGQVLGATTYAETGVATDVMMSILGLAGIGMFTTGSVLHVKNKA